jgi:hypothetical protein
LQTAAPNVWQMKNPMTQTKTNPRSERIAMLPLKK